jgi:prepilin-type N-terminal cleavage/methylation domain-containing protein
MINYIQRKRNKKGFTLVELVVVVAILGILAALAIPRFTGTRESANTNTVIANLRSIESAIEIYAAQENIKPSEVNEAGVRYVMGNWPEGPGDAEYYINGGYPAVKLYELPVIPNDIYKAGYYYIAD